MGLEQKVLNALVIEDDKDVLRLIQEHLKTLGVKSTSFSTCEQGLNEFLAHQTLYDFVITDLNQSGTSGADVAVYVKSYSQERIPVYILTGGADQDLIGAAKRIVGEKRFIDKPFNAKRFYQIVEEVKQLKAQATTP
ncbi:response regulator [Candidatus Woesearchaeota archaeon]|nr:response regulator [Candidatus Woesearchaeota archaeon]